jgi:hypothetical protein
VSYTVGAARCRSVAAIRASSTLRVASPMLELLELDVHRLYLNMVAPAITAASSW